jgi:hypothetical protein
VTNLHGQPFVLIGVNVSGYGVRRPENRSAARAFGVLNYDMSFRHWAVPDFANGWIPDAACRQRKDCWNSADAQLFESSQCRMRSAI